MNPGPASSARRPAAGLCLTALLLAPDLEARASQDAMSTEAVVTEAVVTEPVSTEAVSTEAVSTEAVYTADVWHNFAGGLDSGGAYLDNLDVTAELDAEALWGLRGTRLFVYGLYNNGNALSGTRTGDLQAVSNLESGANDLRLYEAWLETTLGSGGSLRLGLYDLNSEFDVLDSAGLFLHSAHGIGTDIAQSGQNGPSIFPITSLAVRVAWQWGNGWAARAALLDAVPGDAHDPEQSDVHLGSGEGVLLVTELERQFAEARLLIGGWGYTARFDEWPDAQDAAPSRSRGNRGYYLRGEWQPSDHVALFGRYGRAAAEFNTTESFYGAGFNVQGLWPGRPNDTLGLAIAWAEASDRYRRSPNLPSGRADAREVAFEVTYRVPVSERLVIQPDLQYVVNPGLDPGLDDAVAVGLRVEAQLW
jgi:porin